MDGRAIPSVSDLGLDGANSVDRPSSQKWRRKGAWGEGVAIAIIDIFGGCSG